MSKVENSLENERICTNFCGTCPTYPARGLQKKKRVVTVGYVMFGIKTG
jgi:hypothetical protein